MPKQRKQLTDAYAAEILYDFNRTCCICTIEGKDIQIHHIDREPENNEYENLAVLCLECHSKAHQKGGFGKNLDAAQIKLYRKKHLESVLRIRQETEKLIISRRSEAFLKNPNIKRMPKPPKSELKPLSQLADEIAFMRSVAYLTLAKDWNTGINSKMRKANSILINSYEQHLNALSEYYPKNHFGDNTKSYFNKLVFDRYHFHSMVIETNGIGLSGTDAGVMVGGAVINDLEEAIKEILIHLSLKSSLKFDYAKWKQEWDNSVKH